MTDTPHPELNLNLAVMRLREADEQLAMLDTSFHAAIAIIQRGSGDKFFGVEADKDTTYRHAISQLTMSRGQAHGQKQEAVNSLREMNYNSREITEALERAEHIVDIVDEAYPINYRSWRPRASDEQLIGMINGHLHELAP